MHETSYKNAEDFFRKYCFQNIEQKTVLDVGSYDVNGSLKPIFKNCLKYTGLDQSTGPNVDVVASSHNMPFDNNSFDVVISTSCFEHDEMFWVTFLEICRVTKKGGFIYVNAPSNGPYHAHPVDNWRFYADSWKALEKWAVRNNHDIELVESYVDKKIDPSEAKWKDSVGIFTKQKKIAMM